jgi:hypothetical protein
MNSQCQLRNDDELILLQFLSTIEWMILKHNKSRGRERELINSQSINEWWAKKKTIRCISIPSWTIRDLDKSRTAIERATFLCKISSISENWVKLSVREEKRRDKMYDNKSTNHVMNDYYVIWLLAKVDSIQKR